MNANQMSLADFRAHYEAQGVKLPLWADAIEYAMRLALTLNTHGDAIAEGLQDVGVEFAKQVAAEDPSLVYLTRSF